VFCESHLSEVVSAGVSSMHGVCLFVCLFGYEIRSTAYKDEVWGIVQYVTKATEEGERRVRTVCTDSKHK
jgi:hypothetical protein